MSEQSHFVQNSGIFFSLKFEQSLGFLQSHTLNVAWLGPLPPFLQSPPFIVRRHSSLYQSSVNQQPWQRRPHDIDGPEDETETDGKEISGLLHTTKCHGEYGSISSWHFVVSCKTDISLPFTSVSSTWRLIPKELFCFGCCLLSIIYCIANVSV